MDESTSYFIRCHEAREALRRDAVAALVVLLALGVGIVAATRFDAPSCELRTTALVSP